MGLLDLFTGAASEKAAKNNQAAIAANQQYGGTALTNASQTALDYLLGTSGGSPGAFQYAGQGYDAAKGDVNNGYNQAQGFLGQATGAYQPLVNAGQGTLGSYYDAIGANGAEGAHRAYNAFEESPGYKYARDQALSAVQARAASMRINGGNLTADILKTATGLAQQGYQGYVDNLKGGLGAYTTGVQGLSGGLTNQGGAAQSLGNALSALDVGQGTARSNILGHGAGIQQGLGQSLANLNNTNTNAITSNNNNFAASQNAAGANILGAFLGGAQLLSGGAGSAAGAAKGGSGGGLFGGLRGIFGA